MTGNPIALLIFVAMLAIIPGCGKETIADSVSRQRDRERETAQSIIQEYEQVSGSYAGRAQAPNVDYAIDAILSTSVVSKDTTLVPQPILTGSITVTNQLRRDPENRPAKPVTFSFTNGSYDSGSSKLALTILGAQGSPAVLINCVVHPDGAGMDCSLRSLVTDLHFDFVLNKKPGA